MTFSLHKEIIIYSTKFGSLFAKHDHCCKWLCMEGVSHDLSQRTGKIWTKLVKIQVFPSPTADILLPFRFSYQSKIYPIHSYKIMDNLMKVLNLSWSF